jgi:hypothetical protein
MPDILQARYSHDLGTDFPGVKPVLGGAERPGAEGWKVVGQDIRAISRILLVASSAATLYDSASVG